MPITWLLHNYHLISHDHSHHFQRHSRIGCWMQAVALRYVACIQPGRTSNRQHRSWLQQKWNQQGLQIYTCSSQLFSITTKIPTTILLPLKIVSLEISALKLNWYLGSGLRTTLYPRIPSPPTTACKASAMMIQVWYLLSGEADVHTQWLLSTKEVVKLNTVVTFTCGQKGAIWRWQGGSRRARWKWREGRGEWKEVGIKIKIATTLARFNTHAPLLDTHMQLIGAEIAVPLPWLFSCASAIHKSIVTSVVGCHVNGMMLSLECSWHWGSRSRGNTDATDWKMETLEAKWCLQSS